MEMTQEWIEQFNKKCAVFLGAYWCNDDLENFPEGYWMTHDDLELPFHLRDFQFHSDWNWIMEVFKKVQEMGYMYGIVKGASSIWNGTDTTPIFIKSSSDPLEASILVIDQFIDWYNEQKI